MTPSSPGDAVQRWPVILNDREGKSPSPTELRLGRMFHGSAAGRRRGTILPNQPGGVKCRKDSVPGRGVELV
jgi:hypothetical protein